MSCVEAANILSLGRLARAMHGSIHLGHIVSPCIGPRQLGPAFNAGEAQRFRKVQEVVLVNGLGQWPKVVKVLSPCSAQMAQSVVASCPA